MDLMSSNSSPIPNRVSSRDALARIVMTGLFAVLVLATLLTPYDTFGIKKLILVIILLATMPTWLQGLASDVRMTLFLVILPLSMCLVSAVNTGSIIDAITYLYPVAYLLLVFPIECWRIDLKAIIRFSGHIMALLIVACAFLDATEIVAVQDNSLLWWLANHNEAQISTSRYAMFKYVIFLKASPVMLFAIADDIKKRSIVWFAITFAAMMFTGTRANIVLGLAVAVILVFLSIKHRQTRMLFVACLVCMLMVFGSSILDMYLVLDAAKSTGDAVRAGTVESFLLAMNEDAFRWITGMGFGSSYYSLGRHAEVVTSELSYLEFIRESGLVFGGITIVLIVSLLVPLLKRDRYVAVPYAAYLTAGIFEPFVFTTTGFLVILLALVTARRPST